jgi:hypothetical protein
MKTIFAIVAVVFLSFCLITTSLSQTKLGFSEKEIKTYLQENKISYETGTSKDQKPFIMAEHENVNVIYYFNNEKTVCTTNVVIPDDLSMLNTLVEKYNNTYVIISETEWRFYTEKYPLKIKLIYGDNGLYFFVWEI